jgi:hypothetical protein
MNQQHLMIHLYQLLKNLLFLKNQLNQKYQ